MTKTSLACFAIALLCTSAALADEPKFDYGKPPDAVVKEPEWKASAQAGVVVTGGNSSSTTVTGGAAVSYKSNGNKLTFDGTITYARSTVLVANDLNMNGVLDGPGELDHVTNDTANNWALKLRYDRFFGEANSAFATARVGRDVLAGKDIYGGGQIGYSRRLYKDDVHELTAELGYDFTYESYLTDSPSLSIHSLRAFVGYAAKISADTGLTIGVEGLFNLNSEDGPIGNIGPFEDTRINAKLALTTKLAKHIDARASFTAKYDNAPAPLPPIGGLSFAPGDLVLADKLDTLTELAIIVNFL